MNAALMSPTWINIRSSVYRATEELLAAHNLEGWRVSFEDVVSRAGQCHYVTKTISYSMLFMLYSTPEARLNTIRHEVAHAITGRNNGHNKLWKQRFRSLGGNGAVSSPFPENFAIDAFLWVGTCPTCKDVTGMERAPRIVWGCPKCPKSVALKERIYVWQKSGVLKHPSEVSKTYALRHSEIESKF